MANNVDLKAVITAEDKASPVLKRFNGALSTLSTTLTRSVTVAAVGLTTAMTALAVSSIKTASNFEEFRISFETMLGSSDKAKKLLNDIVTFTKRTPFELPQVIEGSKRLLAYNIEAEKILPTMESLGNIAAGVGRDKLPNLILAFGQMKAATRLTGMELRQFTEAGVPLLDELAKQSGKSAAEIKKAMEDGKVSFEDTEKALNALSGEGGRFFNLMERQSQTFGGTLSNLKDSFTLFGLSLAGVSTTGEIVAGGFFDRVRGAAVKLYEWVNNNQEAIKQFGAKIGEFIVVSGTFLVTSITVAIAKFKEWRQENEDIIKALKDVITFAQMTANAISWVVTQLDRLETKLGGDKFKNSLSDITKFSGPLGPAKLGFELRNMLKAKGGPVYFGKPYIVGEEGPELFVPRSSGSIIPNQKMQQNQTINITFGSVSMMSNTDINSVGRMLANQIRLVTQGAA